MPNPLRGEVALRADGDTHILKLTLSALAGLERRLSCGDLAALAERLERGAVSADDLVAVLAAAAARPEEEIAEMRIEGGAAEAISVAAALLRAAFTGRP